MGHMRIVAGRTIMKKMLLLCAGLLLAAGITSAEVVSTNIVGYTTAPTIKADSYTMLGVNFEAVDIESGVGTPLYEYFAEQIPGTFKGGMVESVADRILVPKESGDGYDNYFFYSNLAVVGTPYEWMHNAWLTPTMQLATRPLYSGMSVFFDSREDLDLSGFILKGQVTQIPSFDFEIQEGFSMFASPFPIDFDLNSKSNLWTGVKGGLVESASDRILVPKESGDGYDNYFFYSNLAVVGTPYEWMHNAWLTSSMQLAPPIPAGVAAWFDRQELAGNTIVTLKKPYLD